MATTMKLIAKNVLGSDTASVSFSSIPGTYTDLLVVYSPRSDRTGFSIDSIKLRFNGAGADTNHSSRRLFGNGSGAFSDTNTYAMVGSATAADATASTFSNIETYIPNYANTTTNKSYSTTSAQETNASAAQIAAVAGLWSDTSAITALEFLPVAGTNFKSGSSFFLFGITKSA